jgi:urea transporter
VQLKECLVNRPLLGLFVMILIFKGQMQMGVQALYLLKGTKEDMLDVCAFFC